ncbi:hypothetical protein CXF68_04685 [Tenacibaculum sp. Bg11-29]|uniref:helix-turn-helix domain-containing protein n=1 Tax=Tenacibaculum sp. Bg11-29 TaxID=2058306 RepID=UPI000C3317E1|nr:helix-turn-helix domain-containing protein [Tenacibaculum sp. Bg11-29]PKH50043.1 hypothetical protein CXF68_04685 [Tenacibaculum sp. Bg11-29]
MEQVVVDFNLLTILDVLSIATAFMLGLLFITSKSDNKKANIFLGLFLWSLSVEVFESFIQSVEGGIFSVFQSSLFTIPFLVLYINKTLNRKFSWFYCLLFLPGTFLNLGVSETVYLEYIEYVFNISLLIFILKMVKRHQEKIGDFYSDIENKTLSWIKMIVYIFLFFHTLWILEDIVGVQNEELPQFFAMASNILTFFMIYWIGYNGFSQSEMFKLSLFLDEETIVETVENVSETEGEFNKIMLKIQQEKLFSITGVNLKFLASQLELKEKELSRLINKHTNNNFYHFINQFRVDEFKNLLLSPKAKQLSLLGLAEEAGFSSKSTFYTAFKNVEGITPKQYQNQLKKSE